MSTDNFRISVAMASYNGEKYIDKQLVSICRQTRRVDEIVISDDGSKDTTLEVIARIGASEDAQGIDFVVISDNPRHGYCGNFEWAIKHTTGDLIFLSDQADYSAQTCVTAVREPVNLSTNCCISYGTANIIEE